ncbi:MAG: alpha-hydroxy-acid oxidizing enzyme [Acidimicrobiaceae bacterium]|nr:alpha-hydroxy-acid oxidizing enzyme [Acidimicrobiaceae bacterium]|tara:strand:- start:13674 stop:14933 length:1260 start_codon:yes stop_codon:yes gene_type:complete
MFSSLKDVLRFKRFEISPAKRRLSKAANIGDLRIMAKKRLPGGVFDYIDGAAEDERTLRRNVSAFSDYGFKPRVLRDVSNIDSSVDILGTRAPIPLICSPTGFTRIAHPEGELAVSRSAARAEIPFCLSTMATRSIEEIEDTTLPEDTARDFAPRNWFQVYVWKDKGLLRDLLGRAKDANFETIVITVDTAVLGRRERDVRRGFTLPPQLGLSTIIDGIRNPGWTWNFVKNEPIRFANVVGKSTDDGSSAISLANHVNAQFDQSLSWRDIEWFREQWDQKIVLKGIQTVDDAKLSAQHSVDAIALSNHGGRQLDDAPSPINLVKPVSDVVGDDLEIYCDGGIRRGSDIVKAIAMGADACMIGRPFLYGLGTAGEEGIDWVLDFLKQGMHQTMALLGARSLADLSPGLIETRSKNLSDND